MATEITRAREKTVKALAALPGNRCAFPGCPARLYSDETGFAGQIAHTHAESRGGPRYVPSLSAEAVHGINNLILLCQAHHHLVDKERPREFSADALREWKRAIEEGPSEAPDEEVGRIVRELLDQQTALLTGRMDELAAQLRSSWEPLAHVEWHRRPDAPVFLIDPLLHAGSTFAVGIRKSRGADPGDPQASVSIDGRAESPVQLMIDPNSRELKWKSKNTSVQIEGDQEHEMRFRLRFVAPDGGEHGWEWRWPIVAHAARSWDLQAHLGTGLDRPNPL
jgi:hypothetical protein